MSKFTGNIIRLPAVTPTQNSASGVYTLDDQFTAQSSGTWPIVRDQYFNYTTLLLTGAVQGTAYPNPVTQPYSFLSDASTNNFVVSPNGDVSARPFNPYLNSYSNFFSGSGQYLTATNSSAFYLSTGNFTVEAWIYRTAASSGNAKIIVGQTQNTGVPYAGWLFYVTSSDFLRFEGSNGVSITASITVPLNQWVHVAAVRVSSTTTIYMNGVPVSSGSVSITDFSGLLTIGQYTSAFSGPEWIGYISNLRIVKGTAVYTSSFTPPTQPLQNISGTSLLTCQSNRFIDNSTANSGSGFPITVIGSPAVSQNSPFVSYDTTNGSGYFDGNGDYLTCSASTQFEVTADVTIEFWVYLLSLGTGGSTPAFFGWGNLTSKTFAYIYNDGRIAIGIQGTNEIVSAAGQATTYSWIHLAFVRNGSTTTIYKNGTSIASNTTAVWYGSTGTDSFQISGSNNNCYISNFRFVKSAIYTGTFTPPTAPLTAIPNTSLLTLQTRAPATNNGFIDSSPNNFVVTRNGNTTQGSFSPFSPTGWGNYFNGSSYVTLPNNAAFGFSTGNFTVEMWVNFVSFTVGTFVFDGRVPGGSAASILGNIQANQFTASGGIFTNGIVKTGLVTGRWYHIAVVRNGSTLELFFDGVSAGTDAVFSTGDAGASNPFAFGARSTGADASTVYISNARIVKGQCLYTGAFTPSVAPLTATSVGTSGTNVAASITGTVSLLVFQSNRFKDNSPNNFTITTSGSPSVQAFSPFAPAQSYIPSQIGGSGYFDGTTGYLTWPGSAIGTSPFCFECWFYPTSIGAVQTLFGNNSASSGGISVRLITSTRIDIDRYNVASSQFTVPTMAANQWYHLVACRDASNNTTIFLNGVRSSTGTISDSYNYGNAASIGYLNSTFPQMFGGNIAAARLVTGSTPYDPTQTTITVPTAPLTAIPNTSLLLNFTNGGIVDATGKNNLETVGNSGVQTSVIKYGNGSIYFDRTDDYLKPPPSQLYAFGTGDFTVECWVRFLTTTVSNGQGICQFDTAYLNSTTNGPAFGTNHPSGKWAMYVGSTPYEASTLIPAINTWYHVALVRYSGTTKLYVDGTAVPGLSQADTNNYTRQYLTVGGWYSTAYLLNGYISNFRVTRFARYTSDFNTNLPPGPFPLG